MEDNFQSWLHKLFNSTHFDMWLTTSYLFRYTSPGIQYYLCKKLRMKPRNVLLELLPHLVHLLFKGNNQLNTHSYAIYDILVYLGGYEVFLAVKSSYSESIVGFMLCQEILERNKPKKPISFSRKIKYLNRKKRKQKLNVKEFLSKTQRMNEEDIAKELVFENKKLNENIQNCNIDEIQAQKAKDKSNSTVKPREDNSNSVNSEYETKHTNEGKKDTNVGESLTQECIDPIHIKPGEAKNVKDIVYKRRTKKSNNNKITFKTESHMSELNNLSAAETGVESKTVKPSRKPSLTNSKQLHTLKEKEKESQKSETSKDVTTTHVVGHGQHGELYKSFQADALMIEESASNFCSDDKESNLLISAIVDSISNENMRTRVEDEYPINTRNQEVGLINTLEHNSNEKPNNDSEEEDRLTSIKKQEFEKKEQKNANKNSEDNSTDCKSKNDINKQENDKKTRNSAVTRDNRDINKQECDYVNKDLPLLENMQIINKREFSDQEKTTSESFTFSKEFIDRHFLKLNSNVFYSIPILKKSQFKTINLQGMLVFLVRTISSIFIPEKICKIKDYEKIYYLPQNKKEFTFYNDIRKRNIPFSNLLTFNSYFSQIKLTVLNRRICKNIQQFDERFFYKDKEDYTKEETIIEKNKERPVLCDSSGDVIHLHFYNEHWASGAILDQQLFLGTLFSTTNKLLATIRFLDELTNVCARLKAVPKNVRQKGLEIEMLLLNHNLYQKEVIFKHENKKICGIAQKYSYVLDSAENTPFYLIIETALKKNSYKHNKLNYYKYLNLDSFNDFTFKEKEFEKQITPNVPNSQIPTLEKIYKSGKGVSLSPNHTMQEKISPGIINDKSSITNKEKCESQSKENKEDITTSDYFYLEKLVYGRSINQPDLSINSIKRAAYLLHDLNNIKNDCDNLLLDANMVKQRIISQLHATIKETEINKKCLNWDDQKNIIMSNSKYKKLLGYDAYAGIIKIGNDLKLEVLALQIIKEMRKIFKEEKLGIFVKEYGFTLITEKSAYVEYLNNVDSIHVIKKKYGTIMNYLQTVVMSKTNSEELYIKNFINSLVGYSLATYVLCLKDRHNGNILLRNDGHLLHVDYGFILGNHPGFYSVERAPFKISSEYIEVIKNHQDFFKSIFLQGFNALRRHSDRLCRILEIMASKDKNKALISNKALNLFRSRFKLDLNDEEVELFVDGLITWSMTSMGTGLYDSYQYFSNGYMK